MPERIEDLETTLARKARLRFIGNVLCYCGGFVAVAALFTKELTAIVLLLTGLALVLIGGTLDE